MADRPPTGAFIGLVALQMAGSQFMLWTGLPVYRRLMTDDLHAAGTRDLLLAVAAALIMLVAYWQARRLQPRLEFGHRPLLGHVLLFLGEASFFFAGALAAVVLFERTGRPEFIWWKLLVLFAILFASFCHKHQLETLGRRLAGDD